MKDADKQEVGEIIDERLTAHEKRKEIARDKAAAEKAEKDAKDQPDKGSGKIEDPHCGNCNSMVSEGLDKCPSCGEPLEW